AHVALRLPGQRMKDRAHADMRLHQGVDLDLARALEHRRVGADVELDGMLAAAPASGRRRLHQVSLKPGSPPHPRAYSTDGWRDLQKVYRRLKRSVGTLSCNASCDHEHRHPYAPSSCLAR